MLGIFILQNKEVVMGKLATLGTLCLIFFVLVGPLSAAPTLSGTKGLRTVISAENPGTGNFLLSLHLVGFTEDRMQPYPSVDSQGDTTWLETADTYSGGDFSFAVGFAFTDYLSLNGGGIIMADAIQTDDRVGRPDSAGLYAGMGWEGRWNRSSYGLGDWKVGLKFTVTELIEEISTEPAKALEFFDLALYPMASVNYKALEWDSTLRYDSKFSKDNLRNDGGIFRYFTTGALDYGALGLITLRTKTAVPYRFYLNGGYMMHNKMEGFRSADEWIYGVGAEVGFSYFQPFVEFTGSKRRSAMFGPDAYYISPCLRFGTPFGLNIDLGSSIRLSAENDSLFDPLSQSHRDYGVSTGWGASVPWSFTFGLSFAYDFVRPPAPPATGTIAGKIYDDESGDPIGATISFPGKEMASITSDPATGMYEVTTSPGDMRLHVEKEGYRWKERPVIVKEGQKTLLDFALNKKVLAKGYVTGTITDRATSQPLGATISFPETKLTPVSSDLSTGMYKATLPPGTYVATISSEGYIPQSRPVVVNKDMTTAQDFALLKKGAKITLRGINFDTGKATIRPDSYPILDEAVKLLTDNPRVRVEVQGHTDSVGSEKYNQGLSERRAQSVLNYLTQKGIEPARLVSRGYGESMPIAPNTTKEGRARNRRIDFLILGE